MADQDPDPTAGIAQLLRLVEGGVAVGQLPEPTEPDHAEEGSEAGAERFGAFPLKSSTMAGTDTDQRE